MGKGRGKGRGVKARRGCMNAICCADMADIDLDLAIWAYPRLVVERTYLVLFIACVVVFGTTFAVGFNGQLGLTEETNYDWTISNTEPSERWDGYDSARGQVDELADTGDTVSVAEEILHRGMSSGRNGLLLLWSTKDDSDIFTPAHIKTMCTVENIVMGHPDYMANLCQLNYAPDNTHNDECKIQPASVLSFFYDREVAANTTGALPRKGGKGWTVGDKDCPLLPASVVTAVKDRLTNPAYFAATSFFLGGDILLTPGKTAYARSNINLGGPANNCPSVLVEGFDELDDCAPAGPRGDEDVDAPRVYAKTPGRRSEQQDTYYNPFWVDIEKELYDKFGMTDYTDPSDIDGLELVFWGSSMGAGEFNDTISGDLLWSIGSILIVLFFICLHTRSFFLGGFGMIQVRAISYQKMMDFILRNVEFHTKNDASGESRSSSACRWRCSSTAQCLKWSL